MKLPWLSIITLVFAVAFGAVILWLISDEPNLAIRSFFLVPLKNSYFLSQILIGAVPLIFTGLSAACAFNTSIFNIGIEGQLYFGTFVGTFVALSFNNRFGVLPSIVTAFFVGVAVASLLVLLKVKAKINELISSFLLSQALIHVVNYLLNAFLRDPLAALTATRYLKFTIPTLPLLNVHIGFLMAVLSAVLLEVLFSRTTLGYELRLTGKNFTFARYAGVNVEKAWLIGSALSGGLAALGGIIDVMAVHGRMVKGFSFGYGWNGIAVALLARNRPVFVIFSALFFSYLETGAQVASIFANTTPEVSKLVQASVFYLVTAEALVNFKRRGLK